jgi:hypothetical protein
MKHIYVVAFTGHMVDEPGRIPPRFPGSKVNAVGQAIADRLRSLKNIEEGFCSSARGSDILFAEEMLKLIRPIHVFLPFPRADFAKTSVGFGWDQRFSNVIRNPLVDVTELSDHIPPEEQQPEAFDRCNRQIEEATILAAARIGGAPLLLTVWDGDRRQERGGTADALREWQNAGHPVEIIDISSL